MKRIFSIFTALCMLCTLFTAVPASAADVEVLTFDAATGTITSCDMSAEGELVIPNEIDGVKVTAVDDEAFAGCVGLTSITLSEGLTRIGQFAFRDCTGLTSVNIPDSVTSIGGKAFYNTGYYSNEDNWKNNLLYIDSCLVDTKEINGEYIIESGTRLIADSAFEGCRGLTSAELPDSVKIIGENAFAFCAGLTGVTMNGVVSIGDQAFEDCAALANAELPAGLTSVGTDAFSGCAALTEITVPESVTSINSGAFSGCGSLIIKVDANNQNYLDTDGVLFTKDKHTILAYAKDKIQPEYAVPDGVTSIGDNAFDMCESLTGVTLPNGVTSVGDYAFHGCGLTSIELPDGVTTVGMDAFMYCEALTRATIPESVESIGSGAFDSCTSLTDIRIPQNVTSIGEFTFYNCASMKSVTLPEGLTSIGRSTFRGCDALTDVYYSGTIADWDNIEIGEVNDALLGAEIHCSDDWVDDLLGFDPETGTITYCDEYDAEGDLVIPDEIDGVKVTAIGAYAFEYCEDLTSITIPEGVTSIGDWAFSECTGLTSITIPDSVTSIGEYAFDSCHRLTGITIPEDVTSISNSVFSECTGLTSVTIPDGVTSIGEDAFSGCTALTDITVPAGVESIGEGAFSGCGSLNITVAADNQTYCDTDGVLFTKDNKAIVAYAKDKIQAEYVIPDGTETIEITAFQHCGNLTGITIPAGVTSISCC